MEKIPNYIPVLVFDANHVFVEEMRDVSFALIHCRNSLPGLHVEQEITEGIKELTSLMVGYWFSRKHLYGIVLFHSVEFRLGHIPIVLLVVPKFTISH